MMKKSKLFEMAVCTLAAEFQTSLLNHWGTHVYLPTEVRTRDGSGTTPCWTFRMPLAMYVMAR